MDIIYYDGSVLHCEQIIFSENELIADDIYVVPFCEILRIVSA